MSSITRLRRFAFALAPLVGLGLLAAPGAAGPAGADVPISAVSPGSPMLPGPVPTPGTPDAALNNAAATSHNWSGYAATGSTYTSVSSSWVEPVATCTSTTTKLAAFWVGLDGDGSNSVEQIGTTAACSGGAASYFAWYEMFPAASKNLAKPVAAGDVMNASVVATSPTSFVLKISDATQGWAFRTIQTASTAPARASAEVITEDPSNGTTLYPLADFGTIGYSNALIDGLALVKAAPTQINMITQTTPTRLMDRTSALSGGTSFTDTWLRSK
jgi:hypothetical protein